VTILVSLISKKGAVVASDGRRLSPTGRIETDNARKAFRCSYAPFLCGLAGQLAPGGLEVSDTVNDVVRSYARGVLSTVVENVARAVEEMLRSVSESQVAFANREVDVILAGCDAGVMRAALIAIRPNIGERSLQTNISCVGPGEYIATGDPAACGAVKVRIRAGQSVKTWKVSRLEQYAMSLVRIGTAAAGPARRFPDQISCGGICSCVSVSRREAC